MNSTTKIALASFLFASLLLNARAQVQAGMQTMRKVEKIFGEDAPVYEDQRRPAPSGVKPSATTVVSARGTGADTRSSAPTNWVVAGAVPVNYSKLELKIISGTAQKRAATINNQTFFAGESFKVTVGTNRVSVTCLEITERSAVVKVAGEAQPRELKFPTWR
jgi:hypothetical protein